MIYLDYAATSWPKPPEVILAMNHFLEKAGGNPGRSGHSLSIEAGRVVYDAREAVADLFHAADPMRIIFTQNATHAINLGLNGLLKPGDHVVTSGMEHNSMMRPLRAMESRGMIRCTVVPCTPDGRLNVEDLTCAMTPETRIVAVTHASNVTGTILPVVEIAKTAHKAGALLLLDAAQTAGVLPIDVQAMGIDLLAFTGHKGLYGPPGTGGLVIGDGVNTADMEPLVRGGTGSRSELELQPEDCPDKFESGTPNGAGIAGLGAGIRWIMDYSIEEIRSYETNLTKILLDGLGSVHGVTIYGPRDPECSTAIVSFTTAGLRVSDVGFELNEEFGILSRVGLHCAPAAHRTIGTFPEGTVRFAPGIRTTADEVHSVIDAIRKIVRNAG